MPHTCRTTSFESDDNRGTDALRTSPEKPGHRCTELYIANSGGAAILFHGSSLYRDQFITRAGSLLFNFIEITESAVSVPGTMLGVNLFTTATLFLTAARAYYIPNSNYVVRVAEAPQYLYTPSENTEELSGYSYATSDPNGARSNVIFTTGPDAMSLFRNQMSSVEKSVETMVPARMASADTESKSEQAGIQRMEENNEANQSQQQVPVQQPTLFQAQNSLFRHSVYNLPVSAGFHRFYTAPFAIHNRHLQPYIYNPYTHLNTALHPLQVHYRHPFAQLFYPQPVSSTTNAIEASQTEARVGSASEAIVEENLSTENGTISSEVTIEASAASESSENSKEEVTVMSRNMAMENEESNSTEESIGTVSKEMKMEDESSTVSVGETTDMELTATTNDM